jgi:ligand-binding sensor domain-containing protein
VFGKGIYTIENGDKKLISNHVLFKNETVINIFEKDRKIVLITENSGFYFLDDSKIEKWNIAADLVLKDESVYVCKQLKVNTFVVGTIANGVYLVTQDGSIRYHINQENGLGNNTALSLFEDIEGNIWVGLDNGIDCININAPIVEYHDPEGRLGTIYASTVFNNNIYLGTNHGLFYKPYLSSLDYVFIKGTGGQVWSLNIIGDELFCGHNSGTYLIKDNKADLIVDIMGTWDVKPLKNIENALIQGNYSGIYILTKQDGEWKLRNKISGFDISSKHFEQSDSNKIFVNHEYKGIYSLELNEDFSSVIT